MHPMHKIHSVKLLTPSSLDEAVEEYASRAQARIMAGGTDLMVLLKDRLATSFILAVGRLAGLRLPRPEWIPPERAGDIAAWVARTLAEHGRCLMRAHVSALVRVALAARTEQPLAGLAQELGAAMFTVDATDAGAVAGDPGQAALLRPSGTRKSLS